MGHLRTLGSITLALGLTACGGGGSSGDSGGGGNGGALLDVSGTVEYMTVKNYSLSVAQGKAYYVDFDAPNGDADMILCSEAYTASTTTCPTMFSDDFVAPANMSVYAWVYNQSNPDSPASFSLAAYNNHVAVDGAALSRTTSALSKYIDYSFDAVAGQAYEIVITPASAADDAEVRLYSTTTENMFGSPYPANELSFADNPAGEAEHLFLVAGQTKTYYLTLISHLDGDMTASVAVKKVATEQAPQAFDFEDGTMPAALRLSSVGDWEVDATTGSGSTHSIRAMDVQSGRAACTTLMAANSSSVSFDWLVSSDSQDYLSFSIDGVKQGQISGTGSPWASQSYSITAGNHWFQWCFTRQDYAWSGGSNTGWVDNISVQ